MPACNFILKWDDVVQIPQRRPSYCWLDWKLFDVHISEIHSYTATFGFVKGSKERKNQKAACLRLNPRQQPLQESKERPTQNQCLSLQRLCFILSLYCTSSADTARLWIAHVCVYESSLPHPSLGSQAIPSALLPFENNLQPAEREKEKKRPHGQWNCLVTQKRSHYWDKSPHSIP